MAARAHLAAASPGRGFDLTGVVGDAEFGDVTVLRAALHRLRLPYALGISSDLTVFLQRPIGRPVLRRRSAWTRGRVIGQPVAVRDVARQCPPPRGV